MINWYNPRLTPPPSGVSILLELADGEVHEGHFIKNANKYHKNVNRYRVYKTGKTVAREAVTRWRYMPKGEEDGKVH